MCIFSSVKTSYFGLENKALEDQQVNGRAVLKWTSDMDFDYVDWVE
jgi:hypothetical protein